jgi:3-isopropylmalate/(R)-2-methylmalate dehydratase small subunit
MHDVIRGRVWKFGDNISTDLMMPGSITYPAEAGQMTPAETVPYCMSANRPGWAAEVHAGDILVAGRNFGAGSSRPAYLPLQAAGIQAVLAESAARLFYRNAINGGLVVLSCPGITALAEEGDEIEVDLVNGIVRKVGGAGELRFPPMPADSPPRQVLEAGGLIPFLRAKLGL